MKVLQGYQQHLFLMFRYILAVFINYNSFKSDTKMAYMQTLHPRQMLPVHFIPRTRSGGSRQAPRSTPLPRLCATWTSGKCDTGKGHWSPTSALWKLLVCPVCSQEAIQARTSTGPHPPWASIECRRDPGIWAALLASQWEALCDSTPLERGQMFTLRIRYFLYDFRFMIRNVSNCFHKFSYRVIVLQQIFP